MRKAALKYFHLYITLLALGQTYMSDGIINICPQGPSRAVHSGQEPLKTTLCKGEIFTDRTLASTEYITYIWGGGGLGFRTLCHC
jgi:hypothetical protein